MRQNIFRISSVRQNIQDWLSAPGHSGLLFKAGSVCAVAPIYRAGGDIAGAARQD